MSAGHAIEEALARVLLEEQPDEAAAWIERSPDDETAALLSSVAPDAALAAIRRLSPDRAARVVAALPAETARDALLSLNPNYASSLLARLDPEDRDRALAGLDARMAQELRELATWPADSAGALMDPRVTSFRRDATAGDALERLRRFRNRRIQDLFLVDLEGRLVGTVTVQEVALEAPDTTLHDFARPVSAAVTALTPRDEILAAFESSGAASLPVVDFEGRLIGVLRQRELIQAAQQEATASAVTMVGASEDERALSSPLFVVRRRLPWLQVNLVTAFVAASVVGVFEHTIAQVTALAVLLPVVAGQAGNTGAQALAVTIRGLALREVRTRHWMRVVRKEIAAGAANGLAIALTTALAVYLWSRSIGLSLVIALSMVISMTLAGLAGAGIPMLLTALRQDPAQSSSIFLTTVTDVAGFFSFLGIATLLMRML